MAVRVIYAGLAALMIYWSLFLSCHRIFNRFEFFHHTLNKYDNQVNFHYYFAWSTTSSTLSTTAMVLDMRLPIYNLLFLYNTTVTQNILLWSVALRIVIILL